MNVEGFKEIRYQKDAAKGIVRVTLNTPKRKNALSAYTFLELFWAVEAFDADPGAHALVVTGARDPDSDDPTKEAFSSGGYFDPAAFRALGEETRSQIDLTDIAQKKITLRMWRLEKPVIAAINGLAIGGAFTWPLSCADLIYVSEHAWVTLPFVSLGIIPELASSYLLPRLVGFQRAKEILFFGERLTAAELFGLGLVNKVLPHAELLPHAEEMASRLIPPRGAGQAVRMVKRALHRPLVEAVTKALDAENEELNKAFASADFIEAITARKERRPPVFKGL